VSLLRISGGCRVSSRRPAAYPAPRFCRQRRSASAPPAAPPTRDDLQGLVQQISSRLGDVKWSAPAPANLRVGKGFRIKGPQDLVA